MSQYFIIGTQEDSDIRLGIRPKEELDEISNSLFEYNLGEFDPTVLDLKPKWQTVEALMDRLKEIKERPEITDRQKITIEDIYVELSHKDRFIDAAELTNSLRQKIGPYLLYGESNDRILFSIANYCLLKGLGNTLSYVLEKGKLERGSEAYDISKIYELNKMRLVVPTNKGFGWELARKIPPRALEILLSEYAIKTKIWLDDVIDKIKESYEVKK